MAGKRCCTLFVGGVACGVYTTAAYLAAFCMEIGWIVERNGDLPAPSYVLSAGYFSTLMVSAILLIGLAKKRTRFLLIWLFFMGVFFLPECGFVLYMVLRHWTLLNVNGITELSFYVFRAVINVLAFVCIQSLLRRWTQEKAVMRRLEFLNIGPIFRDSNGFSHHKVESELSNSPASMISYTNPLPIEPDIFTSGKRLVRTPSNLSQLSYTNIAPTSPREIFNARAASWNTSKSEFDAASFTDFINKRPIMVPNNLKPLPLSRHLSRSHMEIPTTVFSVEDGWDHGDIDIYDDGVIGYATQSLERPRFKKNDFGKRSRSVEDLQMAQNNAGQVTLEKINERPFQYLNRPGVYYRPDSEASDNHSIRDIAL